METTFALIYCRVSSDRQRDEGNGLDSQEHRCHDYALGKGYAVEKTFPDSFTGGGDFMQRPAMVQLLNYLEEHPVRKYVVIFDDLKRFARDTIFHWKLRQALAARGAAVECLNFKFEDTPEGRFVETVFAAQGQLEREQNRRQTIQKTKARLERGYWPFHPPPGLKTQKHSLHGKLLAPIEPDATILREALNGFASDRFKTQVDVQHFLANSRFCQKDTIHLNTVKRLLQCLLYTGYVEYVPWGITRRQGHHEALITLETHDKIQQKLAGSTTSYYRRDIREDFPLRGLIQCSHCTESFTASWSKGRQKHYPYYHCATQGCAFYAKAIRREDLETSFMNVLKRVTPRGEAVALVQAVCLDVWQKRTSSVERNRSMLEKEVHDIDRRVALLLKRLVSTENELALKAYENEVSALTNRKLLLEEKLRSGTTEGRDFGTALKTVLEFLNDPYVTWRNGSLDRRRLVYKLVFSSRLEYDRNEGFGTADISDILRLFERSDAPNSCYVRMVKESWNQIEAFVWEAYRKIVSIQT
jgi:site-specific DNA recombinase